MVIIFEKIEGEDKFLNPNITGQRWFSCLYSGVSSILPILIYRPQKDERLSWPRWLIIPRWFTCQQMVTHPSINRAWRRVTTKPGHHLAADFDLTWTFGFDSDHIKCVVKDKLRPWCSKCGSHDHTDHTTATVPRCRHGNTTDTTVHTHTRSSCGTALSCIPSSTTYVATTTASLNL